MCIVGVQWPVPNKETQDREDFKELWFNYSTVERQLQMLKSDTALTRAAQMLRVLGFDDAAQQRSTNALSGGLRMRVALCCAFFIEPDLLLLVRCLRRAGRRRRRWHGHDCVRFYLFRTP